MAEEKEQNFIYEERIQIMVSLKDGKSTERIARFLKPFAQTVTEAVKIPNTPLLHEIFAAQNHHQWPSEVLFKGWRMPQKKWIAWVDKLSVNYKAIWKQTGIYDAIMASTYTVRSDHDLLLGLSEFWCSETNTFAFPWGEATITLEDVMILGGLPVLGEPVTCPVTGDLVKIEEELNQNRLKIGRTSKSRKASHCGWLKHFMDGEGELEHVAFLSLWLSRYVLPSFVEETMSKYVFSIAIHLSQGIPVALAPAVLASLYHDLSLLKKQAINFVGIIVVALPFHLVQLWAYEHFPLLEPSVPNSLQFGEPRSARWQKLCSKTTLPLVRSVVKLADNFQWRPYAADVKNWRHLSYYSKEVDEVMYRCLNLDENLQSFVQCLCAGELTGVLDCKEKYMPHRVAMQFGLDQDLPGAFPDFDFIFLNAGFFVPARTFEPGVSARYLDWWKKSKLNREDAIKDVILELQERSMKSLVVPPSVQEKNDEGLDSVALPCLKRCENLALGCIEPKGEEQGSSAIAKFDSRIMTDGYLTDGEFPSSSKFEMRAMNKTTMKSEFYRPLQAEKKEDDSHTPVALNNLQDSRNLSHVSTKFKSDNAWATHHFPDNIKKEVIQDSTDDDHILKFPASIKEIVLDSSDDDDLIPISLGLRKRAFLANRTNPHQAYPYDQSQKVVSPTSSDAVENNTRKRKSSTSRVGITGINGPSDGVSEHVKRKAANSAKGDGIVKEVKKEAAHSMHVVIEIEDVKEEIVKGKSSKGSSVGREAKEGEKIMAGESLNNPIDLDSNVETTTCSTILKLNLDLEGRVKKLEKILGVTLG